MYESVVLYEGSLGDDMLLKYGEQFTTRYTRYNISCTPEFEVENVRERLEAEARLKDMCR